MDRDTAKMIARFVGCIGGSFAGGVVLETFKPANMSAMKKAMWWVGTMFLGCAAGSAAAGEAVDAVESIMNFIDSIKDLKKEQVA